MTEEQAQGQSRPEDQTGQTTLQSTDGALLLGDVRAVIMTEPAYVFLLRVIHEQAPHIVKYAFYDMGYRTGEALMATLKTRMADPEAAFRHFVETYRQAGYGDIEVVSFDLAKPEAILRGHHLFESGVAQEAGIYRTPRVVDHYSRGTFAGFMSKLLQREVVCEEVKCEFRGDDHCEFVILPFGG